MQRPLNPGGRAPSEHPRGSRGGSFARPVRLGADFLNFLGKLWSRHGRSDRRNPRRRRRRRRRKRRKKKRSRPRRRRWQRRGAGRLPPRPSAFACNPAARGRRRPPPVTSRPLPPLPAPRRPAPPPPRPRARPSAPIGRARANERRQRARSQWAHDLRARQQAPLGPRCSFENPHIALPPSRSPTPTPVVLVVPTITSRGEREKGGDNGGTLARGNPKAKRNKRVTICPFS
jgi:hypothetical protein